MVGWTSPIHPMFWWRYMASYIIRGLRWSVQQAEFDSGMSPMFSLQRSVKDHFHQFSILFSIFLVGVFKHGFYCPFHIWDHPSHWRTHIFQDGRYTTIFPHIGNNHHPNWLHHFSEGWNHQPVFRICGLRGKNHGTDLRGHYLGVLSRRSTRAVAARARYRGALGWALGGTGGESQVNKNWNQKLG